MGAEFLDETIIGRVAPVGRVSKPATLGHGLEGEAGRGAQLAEGRNRSRHLAQIEMGSAAVPPGETRTPFRRSIEQFELAASLGIPGDKAIALGELMASLGPLAGDELDVVGLVIERLRLGHERYGRLDIARDQRDWHGEAREEGVDLLIYAVVGDMAEVRRG